MARKNLCVTNFGKIFDPIADKILIFLVLICFLELKFISPWVLIILIIRDFLITLIRMIASFDKKILSANKNGKFKTFVQSCAIFLKIAVYSSKEIILTKNFEFILDSVNKGCDFLLNFSVFMALISFIYYIRDNKDILIEIIKE